MTSLLNNDSNIKKTCCVSEAHQPDSSHPGIVLPAILTPKEYIPYNKQKVMCR